MRGEPEACALGSGHARDPAAFEEHLARARPQQPGHHSEQRRLARAVRAHEADDRSGGHGHAHVGQRDEPSEADGDALRFEGGSLFDGAADLVRFDQAHGLETSASWSVVDS